MSYLDHARNIHAAIAEIRASRLSDTTKMMHDELALIKARVINKGESADGGDFGKYSKSVVPSPYYIKTLKRMNFTNPVKKLKEIQKDKGWHFSYSDLREATGRTIEHKNFSMSGKMWKGVEPIVVAQDADSTAYVFGSNDEETQKLINYNKGQDGDFLATSDGERELLRQLNLQRVFSILQKYRVV